jgi:hypothetical protein
MMIAKTHSNEGRLILALCDEEILGKTIEEGNLQLDMKSKFYAGKPVDENTALGYLKTAYIVNAVGEKTVEFLLRNEIAQQKNIKRINYVPYTQIVIVRD